MKRTNMYYVHLLVLLSISIVVEGCSTRRLLDINVRCYPDTAVAYVVEEPNNRTTTPGTIRLARDAGGNLFAPLPKQTCEVRFQTRGKELEPVYVRWLYADLGVLDWYKTYIGSGFRLSSVDRWSPNDIYVIDKERAIEAGKCEPVQLALQSNVVWTRVQAAEAVAALECTNAVPQLIESLGDVNPEVRIAGIRALSFFGDRRAVEPIHLTIDDEDPRVWVEAAKALFGFGDKRYEVHLEKIKSCTDPLKVRLFLQHLSHFKHDDSEALLIDALEDSTLAIVETAVSSLKEVGTTKAVGPLISIVIANHNDFDILLRTADCIRHVGDEEAISLLSDTIGREGGEFGNRCALVLALMGAPLERAAANLTKAMGADRALTLSKSDRYYVSMPNLRPPSPDNISLERIDRVTDWHFSSKGFSAMVDEKFRYGYSPPQTVFASAIVIDYITKMFLGDPERERKREQKEEFVQSVYKKAQQEAVHNLAQNLVRRETSSRLMTTESPREMKEPTVDFILEHPNLPPDELMYQYNLHVMNDYLRVENVETTIDNGLIAVEMDLTVNPVLYFSKQGRGHESADEQ
ncbi:MAG: HEAT repeat domain-containing protein [Candidatus Eisenbacteria bacterium]|nr:HEAT repeat domain-containing protein [Candidatus Eisenbacteria bacterium]